MSNKGSSSPNFARNDKKSKEEELEEGTALAAEHAEAAEDGFTRESVNGNQVMFNKAKRLKRPGSEFYKKLQNGK